jgi:hypothetical protein
MPLFFFRSTLSVQEGEGRSPDRTWREDQRQAFTPARDSFYRTAVDGRQERAGVTEITLAQMPRCCPVCQQPSIIGHGRRRKQAHDGQHDWIWVRRGRCPLCKKTFTILPTWSPPHGHYSYCCRQQASEANGDSGSWEQSAPHCKDPNRLPDASTLRRWACRRLISLWFWMKTEIGVSLFDGPTILAWDCAAAGRILRLEANSP